MKIDFRQCRALRLAIVIAVSSLTGGCCVGPCDWRDELAITRVVYRAYRQEPSLCTGPFPRDFAAGWRQGYYNISKGGDPCPPSLPPQTYWKTKYQNPEGRQKVASWFKGYQLGVDAALRDGLDSDCRVPCRVHCEREGALDCNPVHPFRKSGMFDWIEEFGNDSARTGTLPGLSERMISEETELSESAFPIQANPTTISETFTAGPLDSERLIQTEIFESAPESADQVEDVSIVSIAGADLQSENDPPELSTSALPSTKPGLSSLETTELIPSSITPNDGDQHIQTVRTVVIAGPRVAEESFTEVGSTQSGFVAGSPVTSAGVDHEDPLQSLQEFFRQLSESNVSDDSVQAETENLFPSELVRIDGASSKIKPIRLVGNVFEEPAKTDANGLSKPEYEVTTEVVPVIVEQLPEGAKD